MNVDKTPARLKVLFEGLRGFYGDFDGVELVDVNQISPLGDAPIHYATRAGDIEAVKVLLSYGANVDIGGDIGNTALHDAARLGNADVVKLLLSVGANTNIKNEFGEMPIDLATLNKNLDVISLLEKHVNRKRDEK